MLPSDDCIFHIVTPCESRIPLLEFTINDELYDDFVSDDRITATSSYPTYPPSKARMSGDGGWCADSICRVGSERQYLQVDFGAEVVVEAVAIDNIINDSLYVTEYYVEYGSNASQFDRAISKDSNEKASFYVNFTCI